jgi:hypothetical protein
MEGWWFDKESPPIWIDYGTQQWRAWDDYKRATRGRLYDDRAAAWLKANRIIDGEKRTGFWSDSELPPEAEPMQKAA